MNAPPTPIGSANYCTDTDRTNPHSSKGVTIGLLSLTSYSTGKKRFNRHENFYESDGCWTELIMINLICQRGNLT